MRKPSADLIIETTISSQIFSNTQDTVDAAYLQGAGVTGKTHLLVGCCTLATTLGRQACYLALSNVRGRLRAASEGLDADLVALDDVDAIAGNYEDEVALFDLHNRLRDAGRSGWGTMVTAA